MTPVFAYEFEGRAPTVHPEAFVAATATLIDTNAPYYADLARRHAAGIEEIETA